jgi:hypothetical protein
MSTRKYHMERAEALLKLASMPNVTMQSRQALATRAQVHATLAALYPAPYNKDADE